MRLEWKYPCSGPLNTIRGFYKMYVCQYVGLDIARNKTTWSISTKLDQTCIKTKPELVYLDSDSSTPWSGGLVRQQTKDIGRRGSIIQPICNHIVFILLCRLDLLLTDVILSIPIPYFVLAACLLLQFLRIVSDKQ